MLLCTPGKLRLLALWKLKSVHFLLQINAFVLPYCCLMRFLPTARLQSARDFVSQSSATSWYHQPNGKAETEEMTSQDTVSIRDRNCPISPIVHQWVLPFGCEDIMCFQHRDFFSWYTFLPFWFPLYWLGFLYPHISHMWPVSTADEVTPVRVPRDELLCGVLPRTQTLGEISLWSYVFEAGRKKKQRRNMWCMDSSGEHENLLACQMLFSPYTFSHFSAFFLKIVFNHCCSVALLWPCSPKQVGTSGVLLQPIFPRHHSSKKLHCLLERRQQYCVKYNRNTLSWPSAEFWPPPVLHWFWFLLCSM